VGSVDASKFHYKIGTKDDNQHYALIDVAAFYQFWSSYNKGKEVRLPSDIYFHL
jgi:hypothetical protein